MVTICSTLVTLSLEVVSCSSYIKQYIIFGERVTSTEKIVVEAIDKAQVTN